MKVGCFNIRATPPMRQRNVRADLLAVHELGLWVVLWQEVGKLRRYRRALRTIFSHDHGWRHFFLTSQTGISVDTRHLRVERTVSHLLTRGRRLLRQPNRYTNEVVVFPREPLYPKAAPLAVLDSHFSNGGYNGRWRPRKMREARKRLNDTQHAKTSHRVHQLHEAGYDVVGAGDYNRKDLPPFHPDAIHIASRGVLHLWALPAYPGSLTAHGWGVVLGLNTDHPGLTATLER